MKDKNVLYTLQSAKRNQAKLFAVLLDPDETDISELPDKTAYLEGLGASFFFVGGSLLNPGLMDAFIKRLKQLTSLKVVLFPGSNLQVNEGADALLFLSLISGRNPDLLIGKHVEIAPALHNSSLEIIPTSYLLIDGGRPTSVSYISGTQPIPRDKTKIALATALAGKYLGHQCIYLDAGSGADLPVPGEMIHAISTATGLPLIVGGGIRDSKARNEAYEAGADLVVMGTAFE